MPCQGHECYIVSCGDKSRIYYVSLLSGMTDPSLSEKGHSPKWFWRPSNYQSIVSGSQPSVLLSWTLFSLVTWILECRAISYPSEVNHLTHITDVEGWMIYRVSINRRYSTVIDPNDYCDAALLKVYYPLSCTHWDGIKTIDSSWSMSCSSWTEERVLSASDVWCVPAEVYSTLGSCSSVWSWPIMLFVIVRGVRVAHGVKVFHVAYAVGDCPVPAMLRGRDIMMDDACPEVMIHAFRGRYQEAENIEEYSRTHKSLKLDGFPFSCCTLVGRWKP